MEDSKEGVKTWERPWTTNEMRQQSSNWNLAGDAGLLKHLQQFSQNLLAQTHAVETALGSLTEQLSVTATNVNNVTNQFLCLSNTQFLENRVYDDDDDGDDKEMLQEEKKEEPKSKEEQETKVVAQIRKALALGVSVLDTMFDAVEVPVSDSEDEESSGGRLVLEPHNPYLSRPLPYLIGSQQFMDDDHVGLGSPSDSEENEVDKNVVLSSESESEMDIEQNIPKKRTRSSTSASDNSQTDSTGEGPVPGKQKKAESDSIPGDMFGGDSPTEEVAAVGTQNSFAAELAVKLRVAADAGMSGKETAASKPTMKWDADDSNDLFGHHNGTFATEGGLFDDLEDSTMSLWGSKDKVPAHKGAKKHPSESSHFVPGTANDGGVDKTKYLLNAAKAGITTSTPDTHDDLGLFIDPEISNIKKSPQMGIDVVAASKPLLRNSVPAAVDQHPNNIKKKPVGAVPVLGNVDVFKAAIRRPPSSSGSSDDSEFTGDTSSGIGHTRSEPHDSTKSRGTSAAAADSGKVSMLDPSSGFNKAVTSSNIFQDETVGGDSLFSKPQTGVMSRSGTSATGGGSASRLGTAFQKPLSLFSDSDSGDDELLFSSTSSPSSHSRRSQGSGDLLGASGNKTGSTTFPKRGLINDEDLFGGTKDEPGFDIFSTGVNAVLTTERSREGSDGLFSEQLKDPEFNLFFPSSTHTSLPITVQEKLKSNGKDMLFGEDDDGDIVDIFAGLSDAKSANSIAQVSISQSNQSSMGLFSDSNNEDVVDDIFAVPDNKPQHEGSPSKTAFMDSLFPEESDLFRGPVKPKKQGQETLKIGGMFDQIDDIFSVPQTSSHSLVASENEVISKDNIASNSESVTECISDIFASVPNETTGKFASGLVGNIMNKNDSSLFSTSASNISVNKKPVIANKPAISPKPKLSHVSKPHLQVAAEEFDNMSSSKVNVDNDVLQISDPISGNTVLSGGQKTSAKSERETEVHASSGGNVDYLISKDYSDHSPKLEPPKTLNIRKTTGLLFSSSSNEDEDLFGISVPEKVSLDSGSTEVTGGKVVNSSPVLLQDSVADIGNPMPITTERRSKSEKAISSQIDSSKDATNNSTVKVRSVGASPRQFNIDPRALLPGARLSPRGHQAVEVAVSFDHPANLNAILHNAGKDRARIQAKRRPPSRRARQEALKTSGIDFEGSDTADAIQKPPGLSSTGMHPPPSGIVGSPSKPDLSSSVDGSSNLLSPSTDEEDLFGVPQDLPSEYESNKDEGQNLFTCAPVLSPLDTLVKFPVGNNPVLKADGVIHTSTLLEDLLDKMPTVPTSQTCSNEMGIPNLNSDNPDIHDSLQNHSTEKTVPLSGMEIKQQLFDTESLFTPTNPVPELNTRDYHVGEKGNSLSLPQNADPLLKDPLSLSYENESLMSEGIFKSKLQGEMFKPGPTKHSDDLFSAGEVDDLFLSTKVDYSMDSFVDGDLFSSSNKTSMSEENKNRNFVDKSDLPISKEIHDDEVNNLFSPGDEQNNKDLFSNTVTPNSGLFGEDNPESDDLFAAASKKKVGNSLIKGKISGTVATSVKGSLFEDDDDGDLFGSVKSVSVSLVSTKPVGGADTLFTSDLAKQKPQTKMNKPTVSGSSHTAASEKVDLFEDPLMVVTKK